MLIPAGSLVFTGYGDSGTMRFLTPDGVDLGQPVSTPQPGSGTDGIVTLSTGRIAIIGGGSPNFGTTGVGIFNSDGTVHAEGAAEGGSQASVSAARDGAAQVYGTKHGNGSGRLARIYRYTEAGVATHYDVEPDSWHLGVIGVNAAGTLAYFTGLDTLVPLSYLDTVYAYNLAGSTLIGAFATEGAPYTAETTLLVLSNGDVLVGWGGPSVAGYVKHYNAAGTLLYTYTLSGTNPNPFWLTHGLTSGTFWVGFYDSALSTSSQATIREITLVTGATVHSFNPDDAAFAFDSAFTVLTVALVPPVPIDYEDPCTITQPRIFLTLDTGSEVLKVGVHPLRDTAALGGFAEPRLIDVGPVTKAASDPTTGAWSAQTVTLKWADTDRVNRARSETRTSFRNAPAELYLTSNAQRWAGGPPRILFSGKVYEDTADPNLVLSLTLNDLIGVDYSLFADEKLIPQRFVNASDFPTASAQVLGFGVPIIGGEVKDLGNPPHGGAIECPYVGPVVIGGTTYAACLVCGHAIKNFVTYAGQVSIWINELLIDPAELGVSVWAPAIPTGLVGDTTWAAEFSSDQFTDINPAMAGPTRRYTLILFDPASPYGLAVIGGSTVHCDVQGMETVGDGTGTLITDYFELYLHTLVNFLLQSYQHGAWESIPTFLFSDGVTVLDRVDAASFAAASAVAAGRTAGGYVGGFVIGANGQRSSVRDVTKTFNFCGGCLEGQDAYGRLRVQVLNPSRTAFLDGHRTLRDKVDFLPGFTVQAKPDWQCNSWRSQYAQNYHTGLWDLGFAPVEDAPSIARDGFLAKTVQYPFIRDTATQVALDAYYLALFKDMPHVAAYSRRGLCGLEDDVLAGVPITHYNGYGASGWVHHAVWVLSQTFNPKTMSCAFTALDVEAQVV